VSRVGYMRILMVMVLTLVAAGCAPSVRSSSPNHVTIESYQMDFRRAQQLADAECAKYNRQARLTLKASPGEAERDYIFACVD
jgi:hypothetical protein